MTINLTDGFQVTLYPNPAESETTISFGEQVNDEMTVKLFGLDGKLLREYVVSKGSNEITLSLKGIAPQMCYLLIVTPKGEKQMKLVVQ